MKKKVGIKYWRAEEEEAWEMLAFSPALPFSRLLFLVLAPGPFSPSSLFTLILP